MRVKMKFWPKLVLLLVVIALLAFVGARLAGLVLNLLDAIRETGGSVEFDPQFAQPIVTQTPPPITDQDYDQVQGVREY